MSMRLAPRCNAYEYAAAGRFHFHVELGHPLTGLIVRYQGWLAPTAGLRIEEGHQHDRNRPVLTRQNNDT